MAAILEGMALTDNKANIKYGCIISFLRIFCYLYQEEDLFTAFCIGEYADLGDCIENRKAVEKMLAKCAEVFVREKEREYLPAIARVREVLSMSPAKMPEQKATKPLTNDSKMSKPRKSSVVDSNAKTQPLPKQSAPSTSKSIKAKTALQLSP
jgi:hypothetical protein